MDDGAPDWSWADEASSDRRRGRLWRLAAWGVALLVFEVTADPSLVVIVGCSKFGWEQIRAGLWLGRRDPNPARGWACRWLYASWGLWRISLASMGLMFAIVWVYAALQARARGGPAGAPPAQFLAAVLLTLVGFLLSTVVTLIGVGIARRGRVRIWVGREAVEAWKLGAWPPTGGATRPNRGRSLMLTALIFGIVFFIFPWVLLLLAIIVNAVPNVMVRAAIFTAMMLVALIGLPAALMIALERLRVATLAASPSQCWRPEECPLDQDGMPPSSSQSAFGSALR